MCLGHEVDELEGTMRIMLPANYDLDLLPHLWEHNVYEIYGKLPTGHLFHLQPEAIANCHRFIWLTKV
jgi:hypothetical protein